MWWRWWPTWLAGVTLDGPHFKGDDKYLSKDGDNPEAPWPGYGWPLGSECWFYWVDFDGGYSLVATGLTKESAFARARVLVQEKRTLILSRQSRQCP